tara:strand:+ start:648 stop:872 length:225 start_codon:yes stop_codon:yes gene_type:complete
LRIAIIVEDRLVFIVTAYPRDAGVELEGNSKNEGSWQVLDRATLKPSPNAPFGLPLPLTFKGFKSRKGRGIIPS